MMRFPESEPSCPNHHSQYPGRFQLGLKHQNCWEYTCTHVLYIRLRTPVSENCHMIFNISCFIFSLIVRLIVYLKTADNSYSRKCMIHFKCQKAIYLFHYLYNLSVEIKKGTF